MQIKSVVQVMNFHALLRVDKARKEADNYQNVGQEVTKIISQIVYNKNLMLDKKVLTPDPTKPKLNIYIANDYGFCGNFNSAIRSQINKDKDCYKIIIGKKIVYNDELTVLKVEKDEFYNRFNEIENYIDNALLNLSYSEINLYYNHYYSSTTFDFVELRLFPVIFDGEYYEKDDFVIETNISSMISKLLSFYIGYQLRMCECISRAAENLLRSQITKEALDKIAENEVIDKNLRMKKKRQLSIIKSVENYKKVMIEE